MHDSLFAKLHASDLFMIMIVSEMKIVLLSTY